MQLITGTWDKQKGGGVRTDQAFCFSCMHGPGCKRHISLLREHAFIPYPHNLSVFKLQFKTKMQVQVFQNSSTDVVQYRHVFHAAFDIARRQGIKGIYQGLSATILRNIPSFSLYFGKLENVSLPIHAMRWSTMRSQLSTAGCDITMVLFMKSFRHLFSGMYEYLKAKVVNSNDKTPSVFQQLFCGATAGIFYWIFTFPTDVIKSSIQSDHVEKSKRTHKNIKACAKTLYEKGGGWKRFYRGYLPCIMRTIPASASMLFVLESSRKFLHWHFVITKRTKSRAFWFFTAD